MGNRTARNTGLPGTGVEAVGDEEKMSQTNYYFGGTLANDVIAEAEARGYRRGVEDAAGVARAWDTTGQGHLPNANGYDAQAVRIAVNILALLEQTSDSKRPHPKSGAGNGTKK
jgi:hypothetical protein